MRAVLYKVYFTHQGRLSSASAGNIIISGPESTREIQCPSARDQIKESDSCCPAWKNTTGESFFYNLFPESRRALCFKTFLVFKTASRLSAVVFILPNVSRQRIFQSAPGRQGGN